METSEIRIGNYFQYGAKEVFISEILKAGNIGIYDGFGLDENHPLDMLKPIPLTEEWLLKFGWEWRNEHRGLGSIMDREDTGMSIGILEDGFKLLLVAKHHRIKTVHHLQNLYFFITGTELTPNQK